MSESKLSLGAARISVLVLAIALVAGCGKKAEETAAPASAVADAQAPANADPSQPAVPSSAASAANQAELEKAQAALKAKDYDKAAEALLTLQQARVPLTPEQSGVAQGQMRQLQSDMATALAAGDARAKAAADRLRQAAAAAHGH